MRLVCGVVVDFFDYDFERVDWIVFAAFDLGIGLGEYLDCALEVGVGLVLQIVMGVIYLLGREAELLGEFVRRFVGAREFCYCVDFYCECCDYWYWVGIGG